MLHIRRLFSLLPKIMARLHGVDALLAVAALEVLLARLELFKLLLNGSLCRGFIFLPSAQVSGRVANEKTLEDAHLPPAEASSPTPLLLATGPPPARTDPR